MKRSDYIAAFALALFLHGVILTAMAGIWRGASAPARPLFQQGESSMAVTFAALPPRAESGAARDAPPAGAPVYTEPEHAEITQPVFVPPIPRIRPMTPVPLIVLPDKRAPHDQAPEQDVPAMEFARFSSETPPADAPAGAAGSQSGAPGLKTGVSCGIRGMDGARPVYPMGARLRGEEGSVTVRVAVGADGLVQEREVTMSSGYRDLDQSALKAIGRARFSPALKNGKPTASETHIKFRFQLED